MQGGKSAISAPLQDTAGKREQRLQEQLAVARQEAHDLKALQAALRVDLTHAQETRAEQAAVLQEARQQLEQARVQVGHLEGALREARRPRGKTAPLRYANRII